jgi:hypothetical protein
MCVPELLLLPLLLLLQSCRGVPGCWCQLGAVLLAEQAGTALLLLLLLVVARVLMDPAELLQLLLIRQLLVALSLVLLLLLLLLLHLPWQQPSLRLLHHLDGLPKSG